MRVSGTGAAERDVGPGIPLASTRGEQFILAIAPRTDVKPYGSPDDPFA